MRLLRFFLFPLSPVYQAVTSFRNWLYDHDLLKSFDLDLASISVGNLTLGGTGKTPVVEYLINLLKEKYHIVALSRGYKRKTSGLIIASSEDTARTIGDEPAQFLHKYGQDVGIAVCEDRLYAIPHILKARPDTNLILLDDAYQHRKIKPTCNLLLSDYHRPFYKDYVLPACNLRESRKNANRADAVIITKCPDDLIEDDFKSVTSSVRHYTQTDTPVFFMNIRYLAPVSAFRKDIYLTNSIILVTGIAQPKPLFDFIQDQYQVIKHFDYRDHHQFTKHDIKKIITFYQKNQAIQPSIVFTEKDMIRIYKSSLQNILIDYPVFFQPITYKFAQRGADFDAFIHEVLVNTED
jgi:tetraacyldisaccharide 4'-kinase